MKTYLIIFATLPLLLTSCVKPDGTSQAGISPKAGVTSLRDQLITSQTSLQGAQTPLEESGHHIDNAKISVLTTNNAATVAAELDSAKSKLEEGKTWVTKANVAVLTALNTATQTVAAVEQSDKEIKSLQKDNDNLRSKLNDQSAWVFKLLLGIAAGLIVAGIGLCVASMLIGFASMKIGGLVSAAGVGLLVLTMTLQQYKKELIIGCGILLLVVAAYFLWQLFVSAKANKELVEFGEAIKGKAGNDLKNQLFGDANDPHPSSVASSIQSDSTQKLVSKLRQHIRVQKAKKE